MKEEEAKTKWCPMYRVGFSRELEHNRISDGKSCNCIASDCMVWVPSKGRSDKVGGHCGLAQ